MVSKPITEMQLDLQSRESKNRFQGTQGSVGLSQEGFSSYYYYLYFLEVTNDHYQINSSYC